ncbi:BREX-1 system adenine-specific DNA-methyltransferase PglX [Hydrogenophaga sp.]|uniref:BREX-1 system adenine-specific DNA-methyltransferase PglX n=1 Tax=Hydrogenophaga sp. TaxID=1904254 RepID=UPI002FC69CA2
METTKLRRFAQYARRTLMELVEGRQHLVLQPGSAARRENPEAIKKLEEEIKRHGETQVIERVAYTWFNRFCALRFMDVNRYTSIGVVSPAEGQFQPEILAEAKMGHIDDEKVPEKIRQQIFALLEGRSPSHDPQGEAYRLLVVAACNAFHRAMPFLFERIDDFTELLMPDDLLSGNSILAYTREAMTPDACEDVEVIGWLYQFYISEKKDAVFEGLKKNQKISPEEIPAATQLFTPHWIVRYLVENSLGRLWMLNRPNSRLAEKMDYYIKPDKPEADFLKISGPEEIKICDPACGSGHMLTYAFDLLYAIYEEEGIDTSEIPEKILIDNIYGIEIDERAGAMAAFALTMKARAKLRRFFNKGIRPNICVLENVKLDADELAEYMSFVGRDLFSEPLNITLRQFEEADNFGSLIRPDVTDVAGMLRILDAKDVSGHLFLNQTHQKVLQALLQTDYLSPKYHVVIANPPYLSAGNMNAAISAYGKSAYSVSKSDMFSMFIERSIELLLKNGYAGLVTMQSWMFLSSYEKLRRSIIQENRLSALVQIGYNSFPELNSKVAQACAFVIMRGLRDLPGDYVNLNDAPQSSDKDAIFRKKLAKGEIFRSQQSNFLKIAGCPIAYWISENVFSAFEALPSLDGLSNVKNGMSTTDNDRFTRLWYEVEYSRIGLKFSSSGEAKSSIKRWFPYNKGGLFRRWYGNFLQVVNWQNDGQEIKKAAEGASGGRIVSEEYFFKESISWSKVSTGRFAVRHYKDGFIFDVAGPSIFSMTLHANYLSGLLNSKVNRVFIEQLSPTINYEGGQIGAFPVAESIPLKSTIENNSSLLIDISKKDWDSFETSWNFSSNPLIDLNYLRLTLKMVWQRVFNNWQKMSRDMQLLEEENNRISIDAYGLQDELMPEVPLNEVTLTCNPYYRYGGDKSEEELEGMLLADTMRELVSYAVGCMLGRYSLDKPGLILANQGESLADYLAQVPQPIFPADDDNVIPVLDGDWFADDITLRFRQFLRLAFGETHYEDNLAFIEQALNVKGKRNYSLRDYFLSEFYTDHVKRYKKRPIYWLFSSPRGSFNALIYMHRYRPDTVSVVLRYLREYREKLVSEKDRQVAVTINPASSQGDKTKAQKEVDRLGKVLAELDDYEREVLYPLATEQKAIDLDDGVKKNYLAFGPALKNILGLEAKGED